MKTGKLSENILKRSVLKQLKKVNQSLVNGAGVGADCAIFAFSDKELLVTCMQEAAVATMPDGPALITLSQLIMKCANNLAAGGAMIEAISICLILPTDTEESTIKKLMAEASKICSENMIQIVGGQTRISSAVQAPIAVLTGYGKPMVDKDKCLKGAKPGQDVVATKWVGLEGTAVLAKRYPEKLQKRYPSYLIEEAAGFDKFLSLIPEAATAVKSGVCSMHDVSEGGIFGALWELAEKAGVGLTIDLKKIPLRQESVEVCECLDVNPYELMSGGCMLMTTEDGMGLVEELEKAGIPATIIGKVTDSNDRILINDDETRYMDRPKQDELYRITEVG